MPKRVSRKQLEALEPTLGARDKQILRGIYSHRYLTTEQIRRLYFTEASTPLAGLKATTRNLNKLRAHTLVDRFERRIGGVGSGSGSYVWRLEAAGQHLLRLMGDVSRPKQKRFAPSRFFLAHTLAVAECYVRLTEICVGEVKLAEAQNEPDNWRPYVSGDKKVALKPDLFVATKNGAYEDRWFIEIDLHTECPARIIEKCRRYLDYYRSGQEQKQHDVFPLVVFIVLDAARKATITQHIQTALQKQRNIFRVITPDELAPLIWQGPNEPEGGTA